MARRQQVLPEYRCAGTVRARGANSPCQYRGVSILDGRRYCLDHTPTFLDGAVSDLEQRRNAISETIQQLNKQRQTERNRIRAHCK
jgi:hypothetical protein